MPNSSVLWVISLSTILSSASLPIDLTTVIAQLDISKALVAQQENPTKDKQLSNQNKPKHIIDFKANSMNEWMVMVNNQPTFVVKDLPNAMITATKLSVIMNAPDFDPDYLEPIVINNEYIGKYKDAILFKVAKGEVANASLNLTQWINNLRVSTGAEPLTLVEAQQQMYRLAYTGEEINGIASWYGPYFQGRQTASGEQFEQQDFTAAHPSLPFDTYLKVTNQSNGKSVVVRINDRGPYFGDRNLDLSHAAAIALNSDEVGVVPITAAVLVSANNESFY
ncbi:septal ring lytic transglycosylase RlpA family protein [Pseudanabaena mucicola]|uniref:Probable endolytic peptidoglycan transglycosylase RlpA n=1 Tax=Pseudanabaena mucicola FACHB-723 TaxID=2692860 RepID=A0ABR7ZRZ1_9CYAN|nr:septal ring lytic transglycosylase RlpA family protein [Pseudanabaena mucicola]MBD2186728.1 septal ring lytic transglycosylase RlpA family protein [Pseudanabaena mucicola FACHB-723]